MSDFVVTMSEIMRTQIQSLDTIAHNSSNINTPGYKSQRTVLSGTNFNQLITGDGAVERGIAEGTRGQLNTETKVNLVSGNLDVTQNPLDIAVMGDGWFAIERDGKLALTRNGRFQINGDGQLTTQGGFVVQGVNGPIEVVNNDFDVQKNGEILKEGEYLNAFKIYQVSESANLLSLGGGLYAFSDKPETLEQIENANVIQGAIETSNVDSAADMVRLMETTRHVESLQRAIISYDGMMDTAISELGK